MIQDEKGYKYAYDYENRIIEVRDPCNTLKAQYLYDALGRRIRKIDLANSANSRYYYYNDKWQAVGISKIKTQNAKRQSKEQRRWCDKSHPIGWTRPVVFAAGPGECGWGAAGAV